MNRQPKVSIITVNYNQAEVTCDMLESLRHVTWTNLEIFVVDNASSNEYQSIKEKYPEVIFIRSEVNLGFAGGNNVAIKQATGDYILLLNNDTTVPPGFIEPMLDTFKTHPKAGIVSPKIIFYYSDNLIQYAGTNKINPMTCRGETVGFMETDHGQYDLETQTHLCHGACMMVSRKVIDTVGILDESYFLLYEEYDYCERVRKAGFEIYYNGKSSILHKQSVSMGKQSPLKSYYMTRNRIYFARKNYDGLNKASSILYNYLVAVPKNILLELLSGRWRNSQAVAQGAIWNLRNKVQQH